VLREFRPHGLAVEEADGEGAPGARSPQDYDYFLFDPALAASPVPDPGDGASVSGADGDHEPFVRGNQCARTPPPPPPPPWAWLSNYLVQFNHQQIPPS